MSEQTPSAAHDFISKEYAAGFVTDIEQETIPPGLDEAVITEISNARTSRIGCSNGVCRPISDGSTCLNQHGQKSTTNL